MTFFFGVLNYVITVEAVTVSDENNDGISSITLFSDQRKAISAEMMVYPK